MKKKSKKIQKVFPKNSGLRLKTIKPFAKIVWKKSERIRFGNNGKPLHSNNKRMRWVRGLMLYPSERVGTRRIDPYDQNLANEINRLKSKLGWTPRNLAWFCEKNNLQISYYTLWSFLHRTGVGFPPKNETRKSFIQMKNLLRQQLRAKQKIVKQRNKNNDSKANNNKETN